MNIAQARKKHGFTQERLAAELGISRGAVAQWEMHDGCRPDPANARRLMRLLPELSFDDIYPPMEEAA